MGQSTQDMDSSRAERVVRRLLLAALTVAARVTPERDKEKLRRHYREIKSANPIKWLLTR